MKQKNIILQLLLLSILSIGFVFTLSAQKGFTKVDTCFLGLALKADYYDWKMYLTSHSEFKTEIETAHLSSFNVSEVMVASTNFYEQALTINVSINRYINKKLHPEPLDSIHGIIIMANNPYNKNGKLVTIHQFKELEKALQGYYKKKVRQSLTGDVAYLFCEGTNEHFPDITLSWGWAQKNHNPPTMKFYYTKLMYEKIFRH
jgi:hypothetical protein